MSLDASSVGRRVVVRHLAGGLGPSGGPAMNDVIGRVLSVDDDVVSLQRRDGRVQDVALESVVTWKHVADRPSRRRRAADVGVDDLTRITSRGWPAIESEALGDWELRTSGGFTGRANSVAVHGSPGIALEAALVRVEAFYRSRGRPALAQVILGSTGDAAFTTAGWVPTTGHHAGAVVKVADLDHSYVGHPDARVSPTADDDWLSMYGRVNDPDAARAVMEAPATVGFVSIGAPMTAIGRVVVTGEWAGISCVEVDPASRRQGLARRIIDTSLAWAVERGADKAYLQTMRSNVAAMALYDPYGFVDHHDYRYLQPPAPTATATAT